MKYIIETERLRLISCNEEILQAILSGDDVLAKRVLVNCAAPWTEMGLDPFKYSLEKISSHPDEKNWWGYLPILKEENMLIGSGGYHGKPTEDGNVEIGYEIAPAYRNRGLATEMARALINHAFRNKQIYAALAHTLAEENASVKVLKNCGMKLIGELDDPEEGKLWKWEIRSQ